MYVCMNLCFCEFVNLYSFICICVFVFAYLYLCICICVFGFGTVDGRSDRGEGRAGRFSQEAITFYSISYSKHFIIIIIVYYTVIHNTLYSCGEIPSSGCQYVIIIFQPPFGKVPKKSRKFVLKSNKLNGCFYFVPRRILRSNTMF